MDKLCKRFQRYVKNIYKAQQINKEYQTKGVFTLILVIIFTKVQWIISSKLNVLYYKKNMCVVYKMHIAIHWSMST